MQQMWDIDPDTAILQLDISNGYGAVSREYIRNLLIGKVTVEALICSYFNLYYLRANMLFARHQVEVQATDGIFQGDSLSPLLFCLAVDGAVRAANAEVLDGIATAYIDDNTIAVKKSTATAVLRALVAALQPTQLVLNPRKCNILAARSGFSPLAGWCGEIPVNSNGLVVLGVPVGTAEFRQSWCMSAVQKTQRAMERISELPSYQHRLALVRYVVSAWVTHIARSVPPSQCQSAIAGHMEAVRQGVFAILTHDGRYDLTFPEANKEGWQVFSSTSTGGVGIRGHNNHTILTFLAAYRERQQASTW